jgi:folate-binding protein YgfZ
MPNTWLFDRTEQQGRLEMSGKDRLDLLHRMSTNDFSKMKPGQGQPTVLTTALARIIDQIVVYERGETALVLTHQIETVRGWLQRHIFFRDQVKLRNSSGELGQLELHGPHATEVAESIVPGARDLALHHFIQTEDGTLIARTFSLSTEPGYVIIVPSLDTLKAQILNHAAVAPGDAALYESLRIAAGLPGPGHELTEDYIPLEAGLWESVSFQKGCYIGQEIIARMESRNKLAKTLVRVALDGPVPVGTSLTDSDQRTVGTLTSVAQLENGSIVGLGFIKPDRAETGTTLQATLEGQSPIAAEITLAATRR